MPVALATLRDRPPKGDEWLTEIKYDGYRIVCFKSGSVVLLKTRNGLDYTVKFPELAQSLREWHAPPCVLDGEIAVFKDGVSDFAELQRYIKTGAGVVRYVIFDLLYLGEDTRSLPLWERNQRLEKLLKNAPDELVFSNHIEGRAGDIFSAACSRGLEGVVVKDRNSIYTGGRTDDWIKVKCGMRQEFVVLGYTIKKKGLSSLLLALNEQEGLRYAGRAGTGFSQNETEALLEAFAPLVVQEPAASVPRQRGEDYVWLRPVKVAEVSFASWTNSGLLRQASFKGLREDKKAEEIVKELASDNPDSGRDSKDGALPLTSPGKEMYPGVTKKDVMNYYGKIAHRLLPFVKGRLASLVRCPAGTDEQCFYQKHLREKAPGLSETEIRESDGDLAEYLAVEDENGILNAVQLNTIEFHIWGSRLETLEKPDTVVFDLDPDVGLELQAVRQGLRDLKGILDAIGLVSFLKTSGSKGYHVVVPLDPAADWETVRDFARRVAQAMEEKWPDRYTSNVRKVKRKGKIFIDWIRNTRGATSVAPYSLRARDVPAISCPISWDEMDRVAPQDITIHNIFRRRKNPWAEYFNIRQELK